MEACAIQLRPRLLVSVKSLLQLADELEKYNPDQPRDDHGRFGEGGTGAQALVATAAEHFAQFHAENPEYTVTHSVAVNEIGETVLNVSAVAGTKFRPATRTRPSNAAADLRVTIKNDVIQIHDINGSKSHPFVATALLNSVLHAAATSGVTQVHVVNNGNQRYWAGVARRHPDMQWRGL